MIAIGTRVRILSQDRCVPWPMTGRMGTVVDTLDQCPNVYRVRADRRAGDPAALRCANNRTWYYYDHRLRVYTGRPGRPVGPAQKGGDQ